MPIRRVNARVHVTGVNGRGPAGRSITSATVNGQGHLILTMSDNTTIDAGQVFTPSGGGGGGGALDTAMPQVTAPTLFSRGDVAGLAWDGKDVNDAEMPVGFDHYLIEYRTYSEAPFTAINQFDVSQVADTAPYGLEGFTMFGGATLKVAGGLLDLNDAPTVAFGMLGTDFPVAYLDTGATTVRVTYTASSIAALMIFGLVDPTTTANPDCIVFQCLSSSGQVQPYAFRLKTDGSYVQWIGQAYPSSADPQIAITMTGLSFTIADGQGVEIGSDVINADGFTPPTGTHFGFSSNAGEQTQFGIMEVDTGSLVASAWQTAAVLPGAGTAIVNVSGEMRGTAINQAGNGGTPSSLVTLGIPPLPRLGVSQLAETNITQATNGDLLQYDGTNWVNHPYVDNQLNGLNDDVNALQYQMTLVNNSEQTAMHWRDWWSQGAYSKNDMVRYSVDNFQTWHTYLCDVPQNPWPHVWQSGTNGISDISQPPNNPAEPGYSGDINGIGMFAGDVAVMTVVASQPLASTDCHNWTLLAKVENPNNNYYVWTHAVTFNDQQRFASFEDGFGRPQSPSAYLTYFVVRNADTPTVLPNQTSTDSEIWVENTNPTTYASLVMVIFGMHGINTSGTVITAGADDNSWNGHNSSTSMRQFYTSGISAEDNIIAVGYGQYDTTAYVDAVLANVAIDDPAQNSQVVIAFPYLAPTSPNTDDWIKIA